MQYLILNYVPASNYAGAEPENDPNGPAWGAYIRSLVEAGVMVGGNALRPAQTATTVRIRDGQRQLHDGPYADTKEQLGGYFLIEAPDLDKALEWAARNPAASLGAVEVRPVAKA